jgi:hypothetical protein
MNLIPFFIAMNLALASLILWMFAHTGHSTARHYPLWSKWTHILSAIAFTLTWIPPLSVYNLAIGLGGGVYFYLFIWVIKWLETYEANAVNTAKLVSHLPDRFDAVGAVWIILHHGSTSEIQALRRISYLEMADALDRDGGQPKMARDARALADGLILKKHQNWAFRKKYLETRRSINDLRYARNFLKTVRIQPTNHCQI